MLLGIKNLHVIILIIASCFLYLPILNRGLDTIFIAQFLGLVGIQLLWWQVVLGNRLVNRIFTKDLISINNLHKFLGKYGFLIVLAHPTFMTIYYGINFVIPKLDMSDEFIRSVNLGRVGLALLLTTWLISAFYRTKISFRWWKRIHLIPYFVLPILFLHSLGIGSDLQESGFYKSWIWFLMILFFGMLLLKILDWSGLAKLEYKVVKTSLVAKDVTRFQLAPISGSIKPKPGQFAYFQMKRFGEAHPFSVSHYDPKSNEISFSIKAVGPYSRQVTELKSGDKVFVNGPYGVFTKEIEAAKRPIAVIVGGIGITPFVRWLENNKIDYLFYGAQTAMDIAYADTIKQSGAKIVNVLSNEMKSGYESGYITPDLIKKELNKDLRNYDLYICGPPPMMNALTKDLLAIGVPKKQIYSERFSL